MSDSHKQPLSWYEDNANEIKRNEDGSVTFIFDEPPTDKETRPTSSTTISKEDYAKAQADPNYRV